MKTVVKIVLVLLLVAAAGYFWVDTASPLAVVEPVRRDLAVNAVSGNLRVFSAKELVLKSDLHGRIIETLAPPNAGPVPVEAGDVVVQLDPVDVQRELDLALARRDSALRRREAGSALDAQIGNTEADLKLQQELAENNQFPDADLEKTRRLLDSLILQRELEESALDETLAFLHSDVSRLEKSLERLSIVSPFDGFLTHIYTPVGDLVGAGAHVARVISVENIVEVSLSEESFAGIQPGQTVTARLLSRDGELFDGKVEVILAEADDQTRRRPIYVKLDAPEDALVPGATGQASITKAQRENALVVPRRALLGKSVYVVDNGEVKLRPVETGFLGLNLAEITAGLEEGELVIVETPHLFREDEQVEAVVLQ